MPNVTRYDRGELQKPERLPNGWMRVDGYIARSGILEYMREDGTVWREYRPPEEAFSAAALESFALVPMTNNHPPGGRLTAENTKDFQVGTVETPRQDGDKVRARMLVTDAATIADMEAGKVETSCGYTADVELVAGEVNGQRYDAIQRNVKGNHVALVREGRAGPQIRIRLDGADVVVLPSVHVDDSKRIAESMMIKVRIDGVECEVSETAAQLIAKSEKTAAETVGKYAADAKAATEQLAKESARADAAEAALAKAKSELVEAPKRAREQAAARVALETAAGKVLEDEKFDGKSDLQIKAAVAEKVLGLKLDGKAEAYVEACYEIALKRADEGEPDEPTTSPIEHADAGEDYDALVAKMKERTRNAYKPRSA